MDILYQSIVTRLQNEVPELLWIDMECGQLEFPEENYPVQFPALLIDISETQWSSVGNGVQVGDVTVQIRVAFDIYEDTHADAPDIETALQRLQLMNKIHSKLHNFEGKILPDGSDTHFNKMERIRTSSERRDDGLKVFTMLYTLNMRDQHAMPPRQGVNPNPVPVKVSI